MQGPGFGVFENNDEASCTKERSPQGKGILSTMVGRKTAANTDPLISITVPAGSGRIFHLLRMPKSEIFAATGSSTCFGELKFGGPTETHHSDVLYRPNGSTSFFSIASIKMDVVGFAETAISAGTTVSLSLKPVLDDQGNLGVEYGGCSGNDENENNSGSGPLEDPKMHLNMRPYVDVGNGIGLTSGPAEIRVDLAPPRWREMETPGAAEGSVPSDPYHYFYNYRVMVRTSADGTAPFCAGSPSEYLSVAGRSGTTPIINEIRLTQTVESTPINFVPGDHYELRVCAGYGDSSGQDFSEGAVLTFQMLNDCGIYEATAADINSWLSDSDDHVICLPPTMSVSTPNIFTINATAQKHLYGVPEFSGGSELRHRFEPSSGSDIAGIRNLPHIQHVKNSTGVAEYIFNLPEGAHLSLANLDFYLENSNTSDNAVGIYRAVASTNPTGAEFIENVFANTSFSCSACGGSPTQLIQVSGANALLGNIGNSNFAIQIGHAAVWMNGIRVSASATLSSLQNTSIHSSGHSSNSEQATAIRIDGGASVDLIVGCKLSAMGFSYGIWVDDGIINGITDCQINIHSGNAIYLRSGAAVTDINSVVLSSEGNDGIGLRLDEYLGAYPLLESFTDSRITSSANRAHGIYLYGNASIDSLSRIDFIRRMRATPEVANGTDSSNAIVFKSFSGTYGSIGSVDPAADLRMCSEPYGAPGNNEIAHWNAPSFGAAGRSSILEGSAAPFGLPAASDGSAASGAGVIDVAVLFQRGQNADGSAEICEWVP